MLGFLVLELELNTSISLMKINGMDEEKLVVVAVAVAVIPRVVVLDYHLNIKTL